MCNTFCQLSIPNFYSRTILKASCQRFSVASYADSLFFYVKFVGAKINLFFSTDDSDVHESFNSIQFSPLVLCFTRLVRRKYVFTLRDSVVFFVDMVLSVVS